MNNADALTRMGGGHADALAPTRFAVIGCGTMGSRHAGIIAATPGATVVRAFDTDADRARQVAERFGARTEADYEAVLAADDVDAVVLCLPSALHAEYGIAAAQAGRDILVEKPIDVDPDRARRLIAAARANRVCLSVVSQNRWCDGAWSLKQALDAGLLGRPLHAHASVKWYREDPYYTTTDWRGRWSGEGGGVLMNQGIHYLDLLLWYLGEVRSAKGLVATSRSVIETEDIGLALLHFASGAIASIQVSTCSYPGFPERLELHASRGSCILEQGQIVFWKTADGAEPPPVSWEPPSPSDLPLKYIPFQRQYRAFLQARARRTKPVVEPQEALKVVEAVRAIYESAGVRVPTGQQGTWGKSGDDRHPGGNGTENRA